MRRVIRVLAGILGGLLLVGSAWAAVAVQGEVRVVFSSQERQIIRQYYSKELGGKVKGRKGLPPGLAKREKLPPGLQKQIQRNGTLPPGLQQKLEPLPGELEVRLRPLPPEYTRVVIGTDVIILDRTTQKVLDIMRDVAVLAWDITR